MPYDAQTMWDRKSWYNFSNDNIKVRGHLIVKKTNRLINRKINSEIKWISIKIVEKDWLRR